MTPGRPTRVLEIWRSHLRSRTQIFLSFLSFYILEWRLNGTNIVLRPFCSPLRHSLSAKRTRPTYQPHPQIAWISSFLATSFPYNDWNLDHTAIMSSNNVVFCAIAALKHTRRTIRFSRVLARCDCHCSRRWCWALRGRGYLALCRKKRKIECCAAEHIAYAVKCGAMNDHSIEFITICCFLRSLSWEIRFVVGLYWLWWI